MDRPKTRRMLILRAQTFDEGGDVAVGHFVRPVWGGPLGFIESIRIDPKSKTVWATALRVNSPHGYRDIMEAKFLKRVCNGTTDI